MKGYEGHSVVVAEQVVKADESHSVGVPTKETNLASCARGQASSWHIWGSPVKTPVLLTSNSHLRGFLRICKTLI